MSDKQKIIILELKRKLIQLKINREKSKSKPNEIKLKELKKESREIYKKLYYIENKEIYIIASMIWRTENKERNSEYMKKRLEDPINKQKYQEYQKKWYKEHKDYQKEYYYKNIERYREYSRRNSKKRYYKNKLKGENV